MVLEIIKHQVALVRHHHQHQMPCSIRKGRNCKQERARGPSGIQQSVTFGKHVFLAVADPGVVLPGRVGALAHRGDEVIDAALEEGELFEAVVIKRDLLDVTTVGTSPGFSETEIDKGDWSKRVPANVHMRWRRW